MGFTSIALCMLLPGLDSLPPNGTEPNWSKDGSKIAFGVSEDKQRSLWTMNADGTDARKLVPAGNSQHYLRWSPDGSRLAYVKENQGAFEYISIKPDGSDAKPLLPTNAPKPDLTPIEWSPDGKTVAYASRKTPEDKSKIVVVDLATGDVIGGVPGETRSHSANFSPDGKRMLYLSEIKVWVADALGQNGKAIVSGTHDSFPIDPTWSPDGSLILYAVNNQRFCELWTVRPDGSEAKQVYVAPVRFFYPTWSSKGQIVLAMRQTDTWDLWLYTIDPSGKNLKRFIGEDSGAPIFQLLGEYKMEGNGWDKPGDAPRPLLGVSTWSRAVGGGVVRESFDIDTGRRPISGELSITRVAPNTYEAVQLNEWTSEQYHFHGVWKPDSHDLVFDRVYLKSDAGAPPKPTMRWIYHFDSEDAFQREQFVGASDSELTKQSVERYTKMR